jgi:hypothetical protein
VFIWLDQPGAVTTGQAPTVQTTDPKITIEQSVAQSPQGFNVTLSYKVTTSREFSVDGSITTSEGTKLAGWKQTLSFSNIGSAANLGNNQTNEQITNGLDTSAGGYSRTIQYPLQVTSSADIDTANGSMTLSGRFTRGKSVVLLGNSVLPSGLDNFGVGPDAKGISMNTTQEGQAFYQTAGNVTKGSSVTEQTYVFNSERGDRTNYPQPPKAGDKEQLYSRHVLAENGRITRDETIQFETNDPPNGLTPVVPTPALPPAPTTTAFTPIRLESSKDIVVPMQNDDMERFFGRKYLHMLSKTQFQTSQKPFMAWYRTIHGNVRRQA